MMIRILEELALYALVAAVSVAIGVGSAILTTVVK